MLKPLDSSAADRFAVRFARVFEEVIKNQKRRARAGNRSAAAGSVVFTARRRRESVRSGRVGRELAGREHFLEGRIAQNVSHAPAPGLRQFAAVADADDGLGRIPPSANAGAITLPSVVFP